MENFDIDKIKDYTEEDLKIFESIEEKNIESTEELFKNYLKVPFKDDKKSQQLLDKIRSHKDYKEMIKKELSKRELIKREQKSSEYDWSTILEAKMNPNVWAHSWHSINSSINQCNSINKFHQKTVLIRYYDEYEKQTIKIEVIDDVFKSELGNYYLSSNDGNIPLNNVIDIEKDSKLYKWYQEMYHNFNRERKLKRINN